MSKYRDEYPKEFFFDYKDPVTLRKFLSEGGRITSSRANRLSYKQQKKLTRAVKKARDLSLLPSGNFAFDEFGKPEPIQPKPFDV